MKVVFEFYNSVLKIELYFSIERELTNKNSYIVREIYF